VGGHIRQTLHRIIKNNNDKEKLQIDLNSLGKWAVENAMKINPTKSLFQEGTSNGATTLFVRGHSNPGSEQL
jgi:hypothetical protein